MINKSNNWKAKLTLFSLSLLLAGPISWTSSMLATTSQEEMAAKEDYLYSSLRKFLFRTRSQQLNNKLWAEWCNDWTSQLNGMPKFDSLKKELQTVGRWRSALSIGSRLEKALAPYMAIIPKDIVRRVEELGKTGMIELIDASLNRRTPKVKPSAIENDFDQDAS